MRKMYFSFLLQQHLQCANPLNIFFKNKYHGECICWTRRASLQEIPSCFIVNRAMAYRTFET